MDKVADLMTTEVFALRPTDPVSNAADAMDERNIRHVPIVDEERGLLGLVSHRDLVKNALTWDSGLPHDGQRAVMSALRVEDIMIKSPATVEADQDLAEAAEMLLENKYGCVPVVSGEQLVGILTEADFVKRFLAQ